MKKSFALCMSIVMLASTGVMATADSATQLQQSSYVANSDRLAYSDEYSLLVDRYSLAIMLGDSVANTYDLESSKITLINSNDGGAAVQFYDDSGDLRKVTLGDQTNVSVSGRMDSLSLYSKLDKDITVEINSDASIRNMRVSSPTKVAVYGDITTLDITANKARVKVFDSGSISTVNTLSKNTIDGVSSSRVKVRGFVDESTTNERYDDRYYQDWYYDSYRGQWYNRYDGRWYDSKSDWYYDNDRRYYDGYYSTWRSDSDRGYGLGVTYISIRNSAVTFDCSEAGATIYWNGANVGKTAAGTNHLEDVFIKEWNNLTLKKDNFETRSFSVDVNGWRNY